MNLNLIGLFVEIVECGNLSAAARKLNVTRSNVSHQLKALEQETGALLLQRSPRGLALTEAGQMLYQYGQRMLGDLGTTRACIDSLGQTLRGHMRISVPTGFGRFFAAPLLMEFARAHPGITLSVTFDNEIQDLIAAQIDVALRIARNPPLDNIAREVFSIDLMLFASADYLERHGPVNDPSELETRTLIARPYPGRRVPLRLVHHSKPKEDYTLTLQPALESADFPFLADAVCQGLGIGLLPAYVSHCPSYHALRPILPDYRIQTDPQSLYIMTLPSRYPSPATRTLVEFLRERIGLLIRGPQDAVSTRHHNRRTEADRPS
ncbi:LysR family transcriptional regulator [Cupriavidus sp. L7L]|uniref:LysR family transcriptional regulator n=1 Tax=Cupriavidus sp. L7L TaxID=2546443 RepID=UPI001055E368|nr:LysR family transcriptional regulator [Cupriavidus sp. L7L]TDF64541.1 LysR family transcriptional regulator [Cupriavidus sp. L7L]